MLTKMMIQGLAAAILIGGSAAVYAQARDGGQASAAPPVAASDTGYLPAPADGPRKHKDGRKQGGGAERHHDGDGHGHGSARHDD